MIDRRDLLMGGLCFGAAATAYRLKPRNRLNLLGDRKMASVVPTTVGPWQSQTEDSLVQPLTEGKLAARLYSEIVSRIYAHTETGDEIMMLIAYGDTQSDLLQLHRPESCYPAVGFQLVQSAPRPVPLAGAAAIPGRRVVAERGERRESIVYWTRLGEYLPSGAGSQREARFLNAVHGYIPDGALFRFSTLRRDEAAFTNLDRFIADMVMAVKPGDRRALVGSKLASELKT